MSKDMVSTYRVETVELSQIRNRFIAQAMGVG